MFIFEYSIFLTDTVTTMATGLFYPAAIAFTPPGSLTYVLSLTQILTIPIGGGAPSVLAGQTSTGFANGFGTTAMFSWPSGLVVHPVSGVIYITDYKNHRIRACTALGLVSTLAGTGTAGNTDGASSTATFNSPFGIVMDPANQYLYVTCYDSNRLRRVEVTIGITTTLAGSGASTSVDGTGILASFNSPMYDGSHEVCFNNSQFLY